MEGLSRLTVQLVEKEMTKTELEAEVARLSQELKEVKEELRKAKAAIGHMERQALLDWHISKPESR